MSNTFNILSRSLLNTVQYRVFFTLRIQLEEDSFLQLKRVPLCECVCNDLSLSIY